MWHASVAGQYIEWKLKRLALEALAGVGAAELGEWHDARPAAYHIRRRLSAEEQALVGDVLDIRGRPEAAAVLQECWRLLVPAARHLALEELGMLRLPAGVIESD